MNEHKIFHLKRIKDHFEKLRKAHLEELDSCDAISCRKCPLNADDNCSKLTSEIDEAIRTLTDRICCEKVLCDKCEEMFYYD